MRPEAGFRAAAGALRGPERRLIGMLRAWMAGPEAQEALWNGLCVDMGAARARGCLRALEEMLGLLKRHGWHAPLILGPDADGWSEDELALARFVMAATEQNRDVALAEAGFLVSPAVLLPMLHAASRVGLPLLCADCRARLTGGTTH